MEQATETKAPTSQDALSLLRQWWEGLQYDKGQRAAFRNCTCLEDVIKKGRGNYWAMVAKFKAQNIRFSPEQLALTLALLSHVKSFSEKKNLTLPQAMGTLKSGSKNPVVSSTRFEQLMRVDTREQLFQPLRAIIRMVDLSKVSFEDMASALWYWSPSENETSGPQRMKWAEGYYLQHV